MDQLKTLVGDAASKLLMEQAGKTENPRLANAQKNLAQTLAAKERDEAVASARSAPFCRVPTWAFYLPITRRQMLVLGRIYSFQCTKNRDGSDGEYRMSLATGARELRLANRAEMQKVLTPMIELGLVTKRSNGARKPASYLVDECVCVAEARRNGWLG